MRWPTLLPEMHNDCVSLYPSIQDVVLYRLNSVCRAEGRAGLREFYPVTLLLTEQELEEGLQRHPNCPPVLPEWLKRDALASHAADE